MGEGERKARKGSREKGQRRQKSDPERKEENSYSSRRKHFRGKKFNPEEMG